jgi:HK97 family phage prohead protease
MKYKHLDLAATALKFNDEERTIEGYASKFNGVDSYGDTIAPGAYSKTLEGRERPIRMRWNHFGPVIGKWQILQEDERGLYVKGTLTPGHSVADDVYASLKHGAVDGLSIGYRAVDAEKNEHGGLDLKQIDLIEISVVEEPADLGAKIGNVKEFAELIDSIESLKDAETCLRDACGFSRSTAKALVSQIKTLCLRDAGTETGSVDAAQKAIEDWTLNHFLKTVTR